MSDLQEAEISGQDRTVQSLLQMGCLLGDKTVHIILLLYLCPQKQRGLVNSFAIRSTFPLSSLIKARHLLDC